MAKENIEEDKIVVSHVYKTFNIYLDKANSLKEKMLFWNRNKTKKFSARPELAPPPGRVPREDGVAREGAPGRHLGPPAHVPRARPHPRGAQRTCLRCNDLLSHLLKSPLKL